MSSRRRGPKPDRRGRPISESEAAVVGRRTTSASLQILAALGAIAVIAGGCGASGRPRSNQAAGLHQTAGLHVRSSITDGAVLQDPTAWTAQAVGLPTHDSVKAVEFIIDGRVRWIEHIPPYFFNDDHNHLYPWVLGAGQHRLGVRLITATGMSAGTSAELTVTSRRQPAGLSPRAGAAASAESSPQARTAGGHVGTRSCSPFAAIVAQIATRCSPEPGSEHDSVVRAPQRRLRVLRSRETPVRQAEHTRLEPFVCREPLRSARRGGVGLGLPVLLAGKRYRPTNTPSLSPRPSGLSRVLMLGLNQACV